jgi:NADH-quinone oxidoreductase subunit K
MLYITETFDFQTSSSIMDDSLTLFSFKNLYLYTSVINLSFFCLSISVIIYLINNRSLFLYLIAVELLLLASIINFIAYLHFLDWLEAEIYIYYILTVAVAESAFGLGLLIHTFNLKKSISPLILNDLN